MRITPATTRADYAAFGGLISDYVAWCRERYAGHEDIVEAAFGAQDLATELRNLPDKYGPPAGQAFLARDGDAVAGCGAYRFLTPGICELKRVFVAPSCRGRGLGKIMCNTIIDAARPASYRHMRLDAGDRFTEAIAIYRALGFQECPAYQSYPAPVAAIIVFMERAL